MSKARIKNRIRFTKEEIRSKILGSINNDKDQIKSYVDDLLKSELGDSLLGFITGHHLETKKHAAEILISNMKGCSI